MADSISSGSENEEKADSVWITRGILIIGVRAIFRQGGAVNH